MSKSFLEPATDHLLVVDGLRETVIDGISMPDNQRQQEMCFGTVLSLGPDCQRLKEKDRVVYGPYAGKGIIIEGIEFRLLREGQIEGRIVESN